MNLPTSTYKPASLKWLASLTTSELTLLISRLSDEKAASIQSALAEYQSQQEEQTYLTKYQKRKLQIREIQQKARDEGRDIGELPSPRNLERKRKCKLDLKLYLESYFKKTFNLGWSDDHLNLIAEIERVVLSGGLKAIAMPRGTGKTSICERGMLWALSYGHHKFGALVGANQNAAEMMLSSILYELESNDELHYDFPEITAPFREINGIANRCRGQTHRMKRTNIEISADELVFPEIEGSEAAGASIKAAGILAKVRGMKRVTELGTVRPSICIIDDPQTDQSALSSYQIERRLSVITGAILGLAGPGVDIAAFAPMTVIKEGDVADQLLNKEEHPEWFGFRSKMLYGEPANQSVIDRYWEHRAEEMRTGSPELPNSKAWYIANQQTIEEGLTAAWSDRKGANEVSAIQHALNLIQDRGREVFDAEYQNQPRGSASTHDWFITTKQIAAKISGLQRERVPLWATQLTAFIDIQQRVLYWLVAAWGEDGRGQIIDYGAWPEQRTDDFDYANITRTLQRAYPKRGTEGAILQGLKDLTTDLILRGWTREDGSAMEMTRIGIDSANWTVQIHEFVRSSQHRSILIPTRGKGITADRIPISEYKRKPGEKIGDQWVLAPQPKHFSRLLTYDTNYHKEKLFVGLATAFGDPGDISLFGNDATLQHRRIANHFKAETPTKTEGLGRTVNVFKLNANNIDNHWFDCAVGAMVLQLKGLPKPPPPKPKSKAKYL